MVAPIRTQCSSSGRLAPNSTSITRSTFSPGLIQHRLPPAGFAMIDHRLGAGFPAGCSVLFVTCRRNHARAGAMRPLDGVVPNAARATRNEYQPIGNGAICKYAAVGSHDGNANTGPHLKRGVIRQCRRARAVERNVPSGSAQLASVLSLIDKYTLTHAGVNTPSPTAVITPAPSLWGITGPASNKSGNAPARFLTSEGFTPVVCSRTNTSPGPGSGVGQSPN